jgi:hypothetical protein
LGRLTRRGRAVLQGISLPPRYSMRGN